MSGFEPKLAAAKKKAASGDLEGALAAVELALRDASDAQVLRVRLLQALNRPLDALDEVRRLDRPGVSPALLTLRADLEEYVQDLEGAAQTLGRIIALRPTTPALFARRATARQAIGDFKGAEADLTEALRLNPGAGDLYRMRVQLEDQSGGDDALDRLATARKRAKAGTMDAVCFDFAEAQIHEALGDYDRASDALLRANRGMRALYPFNIQERIGVTDRIKRAVGDVLPTSHEDGPKTNPPFSPIFVTGLPRSGTTLVERTLACHPDVCACGEAAMIGRALRETMGDPESGAAGAFTPTVDALRRFGELYGQRMVNRFGPAPRHTDKSMQSLHYAGPILTAMPSAQMVVVRRDPRAMALSLFKQVFRPGKQLFSYDLDDIRANQIAFDDLVAFWSERLPERFHVIDYEDFVTNPEPAIRALLQKVDVSWDPACLHPEDQGGPVQTLSAIAIRAPIHRAAIDGWRAYAPMLGVSVD